MVIIRATAAAVAVTGAAVGLASPAWADERLDGSTGPADLTYWFDPATLVGTLTYFSKPGVCNDPNEGHDQKPISLLRV